MQRLIEQAADEGDVLVAGRQLGRVHYHLSVYQHFTEAAENEMVGSVEVEGYVSAVEGVDLAREHQRRTELTLCLPDGRRLDFQMLNAEGMIRSTGRGLYKPLSA
jgi:hypothetical protein